MDSFCTSYWAWYWKQYPGNEVHILILSLRLKFPKFSNAPTCLHDREPSTFLANISARIGRTDHHARLVTVVCPFRYVIYKPGHRTGTDSKRRSWQMHSLFICTGRILAIHGRGKEPHQRLCTQEYLGEAPALLLTLR